MPDRDNVSVAKRRRRCGRLVVAIVALGGARSCGGSSDTTVAPNVVVVAGSLHLARIATKAEQLAQRVGNALVAGRAAVANSPAKDTRHALKTKG